MSLFLPNGRIPRENHETVFIAQVTKTSLPYLAEPLFKTRPKVSSLQMDGACCEGSSRKFVQLRFIMIGI